MGEHIKRIFNLSSPHPKTESLWPSSMDCQKFVLFGQGGNTLKNHLLLYYVYIFFFIKNLTKDLTHELEQKRASSSSQYCWSKSSVVKFEKRRKDERNDSTIGRVFSSCNSRWSFAFFLYRCFFLLCFEKQLLVQRPCYQPCALLL